MVKRCGSRLLILVVLAGSGAACADPAGPREAVLVRLIGSGREASEILDPRTDFDLEPVWRDSLEDPAKLAGWSFYVPAGPATASPGGGLDLGPLASSQYLVWAGRLDAGGIDLLRFHFREPLTGQVELYWNSADEDFAPQRYALESPDPLNPRQVSFDLSSDGAWRGT
ncbi:MAG TPA: hypothetical protein VGQ28_08745, partial [Thermoanaerobaculia bacterium]|nr:hypothetical protein [Thermoanaerobaculia bacterium]